MRKQIEFLDRMFDRLKNRQEILEFLKLNRLINDDQLQTILHEQHNTHSTVIAGLLANLVKEEKVQMVSYDWTILPKETMKLTIVTDLDKKEFIYSV